MVNSELHPFTVPDQGKWDQYIRANGDPYGRACITYAARWANLMEKAISEGHKLEDVAKKASHDADEEGITGFMYGCTVTMLAQVWVHGEQLRRWHNLDVQFGGEGAKANESGGVLNPALLELTPKMWLE